MLVTALLGLPVGFALILGTLLFLYAGGLIGMIALPQNMVDGVSRFVLLALPFFILAGFVMECRRHLAPAGRCSSPRSSAACAAACCR